MGQHLRVRAHKRGSSDGGIVIQGLRGGAVMNREYFWLRNEQFGLLERYLPTDTRGKPRVDDRRVISGIIHVVRAADAGSTQTLYNRFQRWSAKGIWSAIFHSLASAGGPPAELLSTHRR